MPIRFQCPNGHSLKVGEDMAGKPGNCPQCQAPVMVPELPGPAAKPVPDAQPVKTKTVGSPSAGNQPQVAGSAMSATPAAMKPVARPVAKAIAKPRAVTPPPVSHQASPPDEAPPPVAATWYLRSESGEQFGPAGDEVFAEWIRAGRVTPESFVWRDGWPDWRPAKTCADALPAPLAGSPPQTPQAIPSLTSVSPPSVADRYAQKKRHWMRLRMLAAVSLLVLTLILTVVLTWLVATELGSASPENEDEVAPTAVTAQPEHVRVAERRGGT